MLLCAVTLATAANADEGPTAGPSLAPRVAPAARSYPRGFTTYDALIDYAKSVAAAQQESDTRLATLMARQDAARSEEHTSELQSRGHLVCRLLLEKKK